VHVCKRIDVLRGRVCERETACDDAWEGGGERRENVVEYNCGSVCVRVCVCVCVCVCMCVCVCVCM